MVTYRFHCLREAFIRIVCSTEISFVQSIRIIRICIRRLSIIRRFPYRSYRKDPADQYNKDPGSYEHSENTFPPLSVIGFSAILWHGSLPLLEILVTVVFQICDRGNSGLYSSGFSYTGL